jgi:superfamily II DNA helicase RecQ
MEINVQTTGQMINFRMEEMAAREKIVACLRDLNLGSRSTKHLCETELCYSATETRQIMAALGLIVTSESLTSSDPVVRVKIEKLRAWRKIRARDQGVPAYRVLSNRTLLSVASACPKSAESLLELKGFGRKSVDTYGTELVELLKCETAMST